ncbi:hypothetical protein FV228_00245 [Methylobacterium sp. WL18]|uniref:restriction endonuclease subunit S n=1 Tax=Methylobacterium sp. WL18 TaxID=2603897 RepID=UPI0011CB5B0B|nr:restriction endonuclease subunit S [Methylobacterium sp. WL18]TXN76618.1 hypothetical protein FV228_00245 [Methylobacterium sp. WL18]
MSTLPEKWSLAAIGDVANIETGSTPPKQKASLYGSGYPFFKPGDLGNTDLIFSSEESVTEEGARTGRLIPANSVLISCIGNLGKSALTGRDSICNQQINAVLPTEAALPRYLLHWSRTIRGWMEENSSATTIRIINKGRFSAAPLPLAPLAEQRRIVSRIDSLSAKSKRARDHLDHVPRLVAAYRQAVLVAALTGRLTAEWRRNVGCPQSATELIAATDEPAKSRGGREATDAIKPGQAALSINKPNLLAPENWSWVRLSRISRQETGHTPSRSKPEYWDGGVPWIGIRDAGAHHGRLIHQTIQTISDLGLQNSSARLLPAGTVCLSRTASVGYVTIMGATMATSQDFATWSCSEALDPKYLMYALMAEGERIRDFGEGSTHTTIYFPEIRALHICLAPKLEQAEIVRRVEAAFSWIGSLAAEATSARKLMDHLDQAVLSKAFRGELVPQDPNDEPASVLLERIKTTKAISLQPRRGRGRPRLATRA